MGGQAIDLTIRQERFVAEYVLCGNGAEAARRAGYSEKTARQIAAENLSKPDIQAAIQALQQAQADELELTRQDVLKAILGAIQAAQEIGKPAIMISGWKEISRLCGFYEQDVVRVEPLSSEADLLRRKIESLPSNVLMEMVVKKRALLQVPAAA
jgi:hypothetical protein